jgi:hypothetical protein
LRKAAAVMKQMLPAWSRSASPVVAALPERKTFQVAQRKVNIEVFEVRQISADTQSMAATRDPWRPGGRDLINQPLLG